MYSVEAQAAGAWQALLAWVAARAGVALRYVELAPGESLEALWRRPDLGCALMCGYPWATWDDTVAPRPRALAVPVPDVPEAQRQPVYRTCIVVRADSPINSTGALRGARFAYTTPGSQSGYQAIRHALALRRDARTGRNFRAMVGPLVTPRRVVDAVLDGTADAGPLDSYWLEILRRNEPGTAQRLRVLEATPWTPAPLFVCAAAVPADEATAVAEALVAAGRAAALVTARAKLALADIATAAPGTYAVLASRARAADDLGYPVLQ